jgi:4-oxalocrotonate tautomerase
MPNITIEGPVFKDLERKRILVRELTDAAAKAYALPRETIIVLIRENVPENVAVGGTLLIDRQ